MAKFSSHQHHNVFMVICMRCVVAEQKYRRERILIASNKVLYFDKNMVSILN